MKLLSITITHANKFHLNDYPIEEAMTSHKLLFKSCLTVQNDHMDIYYSIIHVTAVGMHSST
jgi:hypothetical protein